jgi:hypothetical protein
LERRTRASRGHKVTQNENFNSNQDFQETYPDNNVKKIQSGNEILSTEMQWKRTTNRIFGPQNFPQTSKQILNPETS